MEGFVTRSFALTIAFLVLAASASAHGQALSVADREQIIDRSLAEIGQMGRDQLDKLAGAVASCPVDPNRRSVKRDERCGAAVDLFRTASVPDSPTATLLRAVIDGGTSSTPEQSAAGTALEGKWRAAISDRFQQLRRAQ
jgi:hypothetical protein